ncbi:hypothetical protein [Pseudoalteromonas piscicida]|uniref:hypothetical protein n=1 Tax=Pseudoalteromonas piscicida TaxID=43662 RepID=UPI000E35E4C7|nr:hypothetical protein [Pseudoalteromonas piscicida]AXQ98583.1 hypothetical protein D0N37_13125 [Pseudoalteromonas piscicida]
MKQRNFTPKLVSLATSTLLLGTISLQAAEEYGEMAPSQVSPEAWQAISNWSQDRVSLLEYISDNDEEYELDRYVDSLIRDYRDGEMLSQAKALDQNVLSAWENAFTEQAPEDNFFFTRYLIQFKPTVFEKWTQQQKVPTLSQHLELNAPQLYSTWHKEYAAPKRKGLSVLEYDRTLPSDILAELKELLTKKPIFGPKSQCSCQMVTPSTSTGQVVTNYPSTQTPWSTSTSDGSGFSKHHAYVNTSAYGAFHSAKGKGWSKNKALSFDNTSAHNSTEFHVKMLCADTGGFACNQSNACSGNLEVRGTYSARYHVTGQAKKIWSKGTNSHATDGAKFAVDLPGAAPEVILFNKAGGAAMGYNTTWNLNSTIGVVKAALGITSAIVNGNPGSLLDGQLADALITNLAGMITRSGNQASVTTTMRARFDSSDVSPFLLQPNEVYHFTLDSKGRVQARGYGGYSDSHYEYGSSGAVMYAANHFTCGSNVNAPAPTGLWFYSSQSGPDSDASLRSDVENWLSVQLNKPVNAGQRQGIIH